MIYFSSFESRVGNLFFATTEKGVCLVFTRNSERAFLRDMKNLTGREIVRDRKLLRPVEKELREYLKGERKDFDVAIDLICGTPFQKRVWRELSKIGYGQLVTYGDIARAIGKPGASRAVGQANGANPVSIIIPCHRVIASGGRLGGYGGGLKMKRTLLELEGSWPLK
jgi:O-6-methylguanine DNA methyltransferase